MISSSFKKFVRLPYQSIYASSRPAFLFSAQGKSDPLSRESMKNHRWLVYDPNHTASEKTHKSLSEQYIHKIPVIYVDQDVVRCIGGTKVGAGHEQVYIQLNTRVPGKIVSCQYCGLKYAKKNAHHHH